jgi:transcriptional regulator with XRE-family HTH domain
MLAKLFTSELEKKHLSSRNAAKLVGIAHTTVIKVLKGEAVDIDVYEKVAKWLGVSLSTMLDARDDGDGGLTAKIGLIIEENPQLKSIFSEAVRDTLDGKLDPEDLKDIVEYAVYKLRAKRIG